MTQKMPKTEKIRSVADWIAKIPKQPIQGYNRFFYHGQRDSAWQFTPSLFHRGCENKEKHIMRELFSRQAGAFSEDRTMLDYLVRAQHFGLPTRLFDVSHSPLVSLYFACQMRDNEPLTDGKIVIIGTKQETHKYFNSNSTSILANLASLSANDKDSITPTSDLDNSLALKRLTCAVQNEKSGFIPEINPTDLYTPILVIPKQNNERIIAQQGAFILFGLAPKILEEDNPFFSVEFHEVDANHKGEILKELERLGINRSTLFPGIENCAKYILDSLEPEDKVQEQKEDFKYWQQIASHGDAHGQLNLALLYQTGKGVEQNTQKAQEYYRLAAAQGSSEALLALEKIENL